MKLTYKELEIELEIAGLLAVEELVLTQGLNCRRTHTENPDRGRAER